jgi:hypothetical protein
MVVLHQGKRESDGPARGVCVVNPAAQRVRECVPLRRVVDDLTMLQDCGASVTIVDAAAPRHPIRRPSNIAVYKGM